MYDFRYCSFFTYLPNFKLKSKDFHLHLLSDSPSKQISSCNRNSLPVGFPAPVVHFYAKQKNFDFGGFSDGNSYSIVVVAETFHYSDCPHRLQHLFAERNR